MDLTIKHFMIFVSQVFPTRESLSTKNSVKNYHKILKQTVNLKLQSQIFIHKETLESIKHRAWNKTASKTQRHLAIFYSPFCPKKITGPKRLKAHASQRSDNPLCIYSFGAFFQPTNKSLPIKSRRGAGAIYGHVISLYYYSCLTFVTKKRKAIASCTFAVFFFFLFYAPNECLIHTQKNSKWREYVST